MSVFTSFRFLKDFGRNKAENAGDSIISLIARFDPETASQAQIDGMSTELDTLTRNVAKLRTDYNRENAEAIAVVAKYKLLLSAAEIIQGKAEKETEQSRKADLDTSLTKLLSEIEGLVPEVDREKQEAADAKEMLEQFEAAAGDLAEKLKRARKDLDKGQRELQKSELAKEKAGEQLAQAEVLAGIKRKNTSMGVALSAFNEAAQENREAADAMNLKAKLLAKKSSDDVEGDANIAAALAEAKPSKPAQSLSDRLAALKSRTAVAA
jgi:chromosome segregation ATPase